MVALEITNYALISNPLFRVADSGEGEDLQPIFRGLSRGVTEMIIELFGSSFYFYGDTFDGVPSSMSDVLKSGVEVVEWHLQPRCAIDEKHSVVDIVFLREFPQDYLGECGGSWWEQLDVEELIGFGINGGVQPVALIIELDHGLVDCDVIGTPARSGLYVGFLHPVVNGRSDTIDTESL